ncbi:MAG: hypothetical protein KBC41_00730 [Candidatus Pacebacteria bacterium]|nr:hypothetical protein [Candidatus Paceibacterota bacterium]MBP9866588.1 hypothetical protein [Candidatus Paceibacterota bacterium]
MDQEIKNKLDEQATKLDAMYSSIEKTRKYFLVTMWVTILAIVLPMIGIALLGPAVVNSYTTMLSEE